MRELFYPERVAVIGVSQRKENMGRDIVENLFRFHFDGEVFTVGRGGGVVFGRRVLASVEELPEGIDVAVILTPADTVPAIVDGCGRKGIRWAIVETGG
ncbi:MAG: CoA-binding protein, partial [Deltaproteobacteria bacterium]|nr:CoA-binding protein [Deltaproteobacteria bacterium]